MRISNTDGQTRSYFVYNYEDTSQTFALASGALNAGGGKFDWTPPENGSKLYTVLMHRDPGGGSIMAGGSGDKNATFTFNGKTLVVS
jgi:hypothetical protein